MSKISAVTFAHNEAEYIEGALQNIAPHVDEIVVVDVESSDNTAELAYKYTNKIYRKPHLICGDAYKEFLCYTAQGDWLLWFYPDERFNEKFLTDMHRLAESDKYDAYALMRKEYRDGILLPYYAIPSSPNYQNRLHRKGGGIFYTELVHAELHGRHRDCYLPEEYWMEHQKKVADQEVDNVRLYLEYLHLLWKYRDTKVEPYKTFMDSYRKIIMDSDTANAEGRRGVHPAECHWWAWEKYKDAKREEPKGA